MAGSPEHTQSLSSKTLDLLDHLELEVRRALKSVDRNHVHDLRVASRRLGQALAVLESSSATNGIGKIRRRLKSAITLAGSVRDCDITGKLIAKLDPSTLLHTRLARRRTRAERLLVTELRKWVSRRLVEKWRLKLKGQHVTAPTVDTEPLLEAARRVFDRGKKAEKSVRALHRLRIAAKKLRYTMELAPFETARLDAIKQLQTKLGDINDHETARRIASEEGASKRLIQRLEESQEKKTRRLRRFWNDEFAGKKKDWLAALSHPQKRT
jgi:CHAD domain-containing protein